jgi:hypothetical protein
MQTDHSTVTTCLLIVSTNAAREHLARTAHSRFRYQVLRAGSGGGYHLSESQAAEAHRG